MKKTILTGIQASGIPHLGNLLGAIEPAISLSKKDELNGIFFIADYHALTSLKNKKELQENILSVVATWLAFGLDVKKCIFFKQSEVIEVIELMWNLSCFTPFPMLANAHSFKDKQDKLSYVNAALFSYPVLMAADILLYDADFVPVGKDQKQHLEITRDIAIKFNKHYQEDFFTLPTAIIDKDLMLIPGTDGRKMSKSYRNTLSIFQEDKQLKKSINEIITDSTPLEKPKDPESCHIFAIFRILANDDEIKILADKYRAGNFGYGHAKRALFNLIKDRYDFQRKEYERYISDRGELLSVLSKGAKRAHLIASKKINKLRKITGYKFL